MFLLVTHMVMQKTLDVIVSIFNENMDFSVSQS